MRREFRDRVAIGAVISLALLLSTGCGTDEIISIDPGDAPGRSATSVESILDRATVTSWLDTVFTGFTGPADAGFVRLEEGTGPLVSRGLVRFRNFPDSVLLFDTISAIQRFDSAFLVIGVDSQASALTGAGTRVQLRVVEEPWEVRSATWELRVDTFGVRLPWSAPGGVFGELLDEVTVTAETDSIVFSLGARTDSLIRAWRDTSRVNTGLAWTVADSGRVVALAPRLRYGAVPELDPDTTVSLVESSSERTFIFDPPPPPVPDGTLRVGGVRGARAYLEIDLPDSVVVRGEEGRVSLRGSTVSRAELVLTSRAQPAAPFGAIGDFGIGAVELKGSPAIFGGKAPVGDPISGSERTIGPDSLSAGSTLRLNVTSIVQEWASTPGDSVPFPIRVAVRGRPEAASFGFWEFGSSEAAPNRRPFLRIVFTPSTDFGVP